jgi:hypothetical protein
MVRKGFKPEQIIGKLREADQRPRAYKYIQRHFIKLRCFFSLIDLDFTLD